MSDHSGADPIPAAPGGYRVICADPPWHFKSNSKARPGRNAMRHYDCMSLDDISALPIAGLAAPDAALFMWITGPLLVMGAHIPIMRAWGFKPNAMAFTWIKTTRSHRGETFRREDLFFGGGFTTRKNAEFVVMGKRGKSVRRSASVREVIVSNLREHSRKPDQFHENIETYSAGPYLELFARQSRPGWTTWGREAHKFDGDSDHEKSQELADLSQGKSL